MSQTTFRPTPSRVNERILKEKKEAARSQLRADREREERRAAELRERGGEAVRRAGARTRAAARDTGRLIKEHPLPAMALGLGLGILISQLLRRR